MIPVYSIVVDHTVYETWYNQSRKRGRTARKKDAIKQIEYNYLHVLRGVNMRYQSIQHSDFSVSIQGAGIIISVSEADSPWSEGHVYQEEATGQYQLTPVNFFF